MLWCKRVNRIQREKIRKRKIYGKSRDETESRIEAKRKREVTAEN